MINLDDYAASTVSEAAYGMTILEIDDLRDNARDACGTDAKNACIYYSDCLDIINRYESEVDVSDYLDNGTAYRADGWRDAMVAYANAIAYVYISQEVGSLLEAVDAAHDVIADAAERHGSPGADGAKVSADCPFAYASHDSEDEDGVHYWSESNLEGCRAVAVKVFSGLWLYYAWRPGKVEG